MDNIIEKLLENAKIVTSCQRCGKQTDNLIYICGEYICHDCEKKTETEAKKVEHKNKYNRVIATIPERYKAASFDNFECPSEEYTRIKKTVHSICNVESVRRGRCLTLLGNKGTGKTHLGIAVLKDYAKNGYYGMFVVEIEIAKKIKATWGKEKSGNDENGIIQKYATIPVLHIDDIGLLKDSELPRLTAQIIHARYNNLLPTIVTGNLSEMALNDYLGVQIVDRLKDNNGVFVEMKMKSWRK